MLTLLLALTAASAQDFGDTGYVAPPVVGGTQTAPGAWPGVVAVFGSSGGACTGTLVGPQTVITAAHCGTAQGVVVNTTDYYDQSQGDWHEASRTARHPQYGSSQWGGYDIAVVTLQTPVTAYPHYNMAIDCAADAIYDGAQAHIVGFGLTTQTGSGYNSKLHEAPLPIVDADCSEDWMCDPNATGSELFAGGDGVDACFGDSGGPLFVQAGSEWTLLGVTSRSGSQATEQYPCRTGGIWTRADYFMDWIQAESVDLIAGPTCNEPPEIILQPFGDVGNKGRYRATYTISDPDSTTWTYELPQTPSFGTIRIDGDQLVFEGDGSYVGADSFVFRVVDDHGGASELTVPLNIVDGKLGCGCATGGAPAGLWTLALSGLFLLRRRRD